MSDFHVRPALFTDLEALTELAVDMVVCSRSHLRPEVSNDDIRRIRLHNFEHISEVLRQPEGGLFVAVDQSGELIGHVVLLANQTDSISDLKQAWVYDLSVRREWWGRGVGRALMDRAESFVAELGVEWVGLGMTSANERAVGFYEGLGYRVERVQMAKRVWPPGEAKPESERRAAPGGPGTD